MTANFQRPEPGLEHQDRMPEVAPPEDGMPLVELARQRGPRPPSTGSASGPRSTCATSATPAWACPTIPTTRPGHGCGSGSTAGSTTTRRSSTAAFTYASDLTLLGAALVPHGVHIASPGMQTASLDHAIWFHRPFRADEWWLYDQVSPVRRRRSRAGDCARCSRQDGELVATVAQEGLIRVRDERA